MGAINDVRWFLYLTARLLGDLNAILRGRILRRICVRIVGAHMGRLIGRAFRGWWI